MSKKINIGIVGATGLVGETFLDLLIPSKHQFDKIKLFASPNSKGKKVSFREQTLEIDVLGDNCFQGLDVVFFSSGDDISKEWAPKAAAQGAIAIDNSAAYRMAPNTPLVVPEINFASMKNPASPRVIANPNCSTIQLVMVLHALRNFGLQEVRVASYQSVSGAGRDGIEELKNQTSSYLSGEPAQPGQCFNPPIAFDCQPVIGSMKDNGFCSEEIKIMNETKKILEMPDLKVSASTVRVPTLNGHGENVWLTFDKDVSREQLESTLDECSFIQYRRDREQPSFHTYKEVTGQSDAFVSRLRKDLTFANTWIFWLVADNLYRGAASNGLLIAERIFDNIAQS